MPFRRDQVKEIAERHHQVDLEDMFFSTTDRRGVIQLANEVFVRVARYGRPVLVGAPHNIVRHPDMPGGAFALAWQLLEQGRPVCAYVLNRAGDGSAYWAMASIVPISGGYLSVRTRPMREDLRATVEKIYRQIRAQEVAARAGGASASEAARQGATALRAALANLGFPDYEAFQRAMLPAEAEARVNRAPKLPDRPLAPRTLGRMLTALTESTQTVHELSRDMRRFAADSDRLDGQLKATQQALHALEGAIDAASHAAAPLGAEAPVLAQAAPGVRTRAHETRAAVDRLEEAVARLSTSRSQLTFDTSLVQLQAEMAGHFVVALIDGSEDPESADEALQMLADTLRRELGALDAALRENLDATDEVRASLAATTTSLRILSLAQGTWRDLVDRYQVQEQLAEVMPPLDSALRITESRVAELREIVESFGTVRVNVDLLALDEQIAAAMAAVATVPA